MEGRPALFLAGVIMLCSVGVGFGLQNGLRVQSFQGIPHMLQIECSAQPIESDADLYSIAIFRHSDGAAIASMRPWKDECLTSSSFSSCHVDRRNVRHTRLATLVSVAEYEEYRERMFGCNVTFESKRSGKMRKEAWFVSVQRPDAVSDDFYDELISDIRS